MTHAPNTPRQRNSKGQKVDEPVQCVQCLQAWPCEVMLLSQQVIALASENAALRGPKPPGDGWVAFGTHANCKVSLDFWGVGEDGLPIWEQVIVPEATDDENLRTWKEETGG